MGFPPPRSRRLQQHITNKRFYHLRAVLLSEVESEQYWSEEDQFYELFNSFLAERFDDSAPRT